MFYCHYKINMTSIRSTEKNSITATPVIAATTATATSAITTATIATATTTSFTATIITLTVTLTIATVTTTNTGPADYTLIINTTTKILLLKPALLLSLGQFLYYCC